MKTRELRKRGEGGFVAAKTALITTASILATAGIGVIAATSFSSAAVTPKLSQAATASGVCVTAVMIERPEVQNQAGSCKTENIPETPDNPDPTTPPEQTEEPTAPPTEEPSPSPDPTLPPKPTDPVVPPGPVIDYEQIMVTTWDTTATTCRQITLPISGEIHGTVQWGKDTTPKDLISTTNKSPDLPANQLVEVTIEGVFNEWGGSGWSNSNCLVSVDRWGETETKSLFYGFNNADNLKRVEAIPSTIQDMRHTFGNVDSDFTLGKLNTESVTNMGGLFNSATKFNQSIEFDTKNVLDMNAMFMRAKEFNSSINFNDTSKVLNMQQMFFEAAKFDQPVNFNTSSVTSMNSMFGSAKAFNQPVNFDTKNVAHFTGMFMGASSFNQPISFDTSQAQIFQHFFSGATVFNSPVHFTDTSKVKSMYQMFSKSPKFNQPLNIDTSNVTDMRDTFLNATDFSQNLSGWNVNKVTSIYRTGFSTNSGLTAAQLPKWK